MTPVLLLLAKSRQAEEAALAPSSYLFADGVVDVAPYPQLRFVTLTAAMGLRARGGEEQPQPLYHGAGPGGTL